MSGDCYFCRGIVFPSEPDDMLLDSHADHVVYMHRRCAEGYNAIESTEAAGETETVICPECGAVEQVASAPPKRASDSSRD